MAYIILPHRWRRQPSGPLALDTSNPLARGVSAIWDARDRRFFGRATQAGDITTPRNGPSGIGRNFNGGIEFVQYSHHADLAPTGDMAIGVVCDVDALTFYTPILAKQATTTNACPYELRIGDGATDSHVVLVRANSTYRYWTSSSNQLAAGDRNVRLLVSAPNLIESQPTGFVNGRRFDMASNDGGGTGAATDNGSSAVNFGVRPDGGTHFDGAMYLVVLYNRTLADAEGIEWSRNPWQMFRPIQRRLYVGPSAGGGAQEGAHGSQGAASGSTTAALLLAGAHASQGTAAGSATASMLLVGLHTSQAGALGSTDYLSALTGDHASAAAALGASSAQLLLVGLQSGAAIAVDAATAALALAGAGSGAATAGGASSALHARFARPISDVSNTGWTSTEGTLAEALSEHTRADASYIRATSAATAKVALTQMDDPGATLHAITIASPAGYSPSGTLTVRLHCGATQIAEWVITDLAADDERTLELTSEQRDAITDYTDLDLTFVAS